MNGFIIKRLTVSGEGHSPSTIDFSDRVNLIIGPSNTGKSLIMDCIDYVFGFTPKSDKPSKIVDNNNGYTHIELVLDSDNGSLTLKREIGSTKIEVISGISNIDCGFYSADHKAKKNISDILLYLIGIDTTHKVLASQAGKTQKLTWRTILHLFLMKQKDIDRETSALLMPDQRGRTPSASALLFLLTGLDANDVKKQEDPTISKAKREAIIMYIRSKKDQLIAKKESIEKKLPNHDVQDSKRLVDSLQAEINILQEQLNEANDKGKELLNDLYNNNSLLSETNTLLRNFESLNNQYKSDIRRLEFIIDGQTASIDITPHKNCPFCNNELKNPPKKDYIESAVSELNNLKSHLVNLENAQSSALKKKEIVEKKIIELEKSKADLDDYINSSLKPKLDTFNEELNKHLKIMQMHFELASLKEIETEFGTDLFIQETKEDEAINKYNIFSQFDLQLIQAFEEKLKYALEKSKIGGASSARLNMKSFDIEIDNINKASSMGGGYCAILNALVSYSMHSFILERNGYSPNFFAIDSALTQLSEAEYVEAINSVKQGFLEFILKQNHNRQIIMIEQKDELPFIPEHCPDKGINVIEFTRNPNSGRYGFLNDVVNAEHK